MSKTDKDRPHWVVNAESGVIDHDHRSGRCVVEEPPGTRWRSWRHHWRRCAKRVKTTWFCTKSDPHLDYRGRKTCWTAAYVRDDPDDYYSFRWVVRQCDGHDKITVVDEIPCCCDDRPEDPTCTFAWSFRYGSPPKWYIDEIFHRPERRRERGQLESMRREFNASGWDAAEDFDFDNRQARSGAKYTWW